MSKKQIENKIDELESERKNASRERQKEIKKQLKTCRALKGGGDSDNEGNETDETGNETDETDETDIETETEADDSDYDSDCEEGMSKKQIENKIDKLESERKNASRERQKEIKNQLKTCRVLKGGGGDDNEGNTQKEKPNNNSNLKDNTMDSGDSGVNMNLGDNMTGDINIALPDTKNADEDDNAFFLEVLEAQNDQVENINNITKLVEEKANSR